MGGNGHPPPPATSCQASASASASMPYVNLERLNRDDQNSCFGPLRCWHNLCPDYLLAWNSLSLGLIHTLDPESNAKKGT